MRFLALRERHATLAAANPFTMQYDVVHCATTSDVNEATPHEKTPEVSKLNVFDRSSACKDNVLNATRNLIISLS